MAPAADDGCECNAGCCATTGGCAVTHQNCIGGTTVCGTGADAIGQSYWDATDYCAALGTPGTSATYTSDMAMAAAMAAPQQTAAKCSNPPCTGSTSCSVNGTVQDAVYDDLTDTGGPCIVWMYKGTTGSLTAGYVHIDLTGCNCPTKADPTWD